MDRGAWQAKSMGLHDSMCAQGRWVGSNKVVELKKKKRKKKSRHVILLTEVCLVKAMVFPVVMYGCESWTIMLLNCGVEDSSESLGL